MVADIQRFTGVTTGFVGNLGVLSVSILLDSSRAVRT